MTRHLSGDKGPGPAGGERPDQQRPLPTCSTVISAPIIRAGRHLPACCAVVSVVVSVIHRRTGCESCRADMVADCLLLIATGEPHCTGASVTL
jgi:hypothetical protein